MSGKESDGWDWSTTSSRTSKDSRDFGGSEKQDSAEGLLGYEVFDHDELKEILANNGKTNEALLNFGTPTPTPTPTPTQAASTGEGGIHLGIGFDSLDAGLFSIVAGGPNQSRLSVGQSGIGRRPYSFGRGPYSESSGARYCIENKIEHRYLRAQFRYTCIKTLAPPDADSKRVEKLYRMTGLEYADFLRNLDYEMGYEHFPWDHLVQKEKQLRSKGRSMLKEAEKELYEADEVAHPDNLPIPPEWDHLWTANSP